MVSGPESLFQVLAPGRPHGPQHAAAQVETSQALLKAALREVEAKRAADAMLGVVLRQPRAGEMGWIIHRQGALYAQEYGWNMQIEATVAQIVADFLRQHDPACERCWVAEYGGQVLGSVMLVRRDASTAQLRLLYLEPGARGLGLGKRLVAQCVEFARAAAYQKIMLWTNNVLLAARGIYVAQGFNLVETQAYGEFGPDLVSEVWQRDL